MDPSVSAPQKALMQASDLIFVPAAWLAANSVAILSAIAVLVAGWILARLAYRAIKNLLPRAYGVDKNFAPLLAQAARYGIVIFAIMTAASFIGVPNTSIIAILGAMGLAVALALQNTLSNIAAGIMLIWLRPISIGEYIVGDGVAGVVVEIGLFGTRLRSTSGLYIFTPNLKLWNGAITNHSREPRRRIEINFTVPETDQHRPRPQALLASPPATRPSSPIRLRPSTSTALPATRSSFSSAPGYRPRSTSNAPQPRRGREDRAQPRDRQRRRRRQGRSHRRRRPACHE